MPDTKTKIVPIKKADAKQQIIYGEVYVPEVVDTDGDFMTATEIQKTAHNFMRKHGSGYVNVEHGDESVDAAVVESFVAREGDPIFIKGSWVAAVHIPNADLWSQVEKGEINAFSMEGVGMRSETTLEVELTELIKGETAEVEAHTHPFEVRFDGSTFLGGHTGEAEDGHVHSILKGTATEKTDDHSHPFHCIEVWANVEEDSEA